MSHFGKFSAALALAIAATSTVYAQPRFSAGDAFFVTQSYRTEESSSDGSSGNSNGSTAWIIRVQSSDHDGTLFELDIPDATEQDRLRQWELPAQIRRLPDGTAQLANRDVMLRRRDEWLTRANWTSEQCGRWYFTWTAFRINCDPASVLETFALIFPIASDGGGVFSHSLAQRGEPLVPCPDDPRPGCLTVTLEVDAGRVLADFAEQDAVVRELSGARELETRRRGGDRISGTILVRIERQADTEVWRQSESVRLETVTPEGVVENSLRTVVLESRRVGTR